MIVIESLHNGCQGSLTSHEPRNESASVTAARPRNATGANASPGLLLTPDGGQTSEHFSCLFVVLGHDQQTNLFGLRSGREIVATVARQSLLVGLCGFVGVLSNGSADLPA